MNELYHHGIQGQKWGRRRWQNEDGTLTDDGKKRYLKDSTKRKIGGFVGGDIGFIAGYAAASKVAKPLAEKFADSKMKDLLKRATPEEHEAILGMLEVVGTLPVALVTSAIGTKFGKKFVDKHINKGGADNE